MHTATEIKQLNRWQGDARLYRLSKPIGYDFDWDTDEPKAFTDYVIVSAVVVKFDGGPETYIFPATENGKPINMGELKGSFKGKLDHAAALNGAGYTIGPDSATG